MMARGEVGFAESMEVMRSVGRVKSSMSQPRHPLDLRLSRRLWICSRLAAVVLAVVSLIRRRTFQAAAASTALIAGHLLVPDFTLPERYAAVVPELRALQGLASWALFWVVTAIGGRALMPIKRLNNATPPSVP